VRAGGNASSINRDGTIATAGAAVVVDVLLLRVCLRFLCCVCVRAVYCVRSVLVAVMARVKREE